MQSHNPIEALAKMRHEFGEHGGVNMSIEASTTFTVMAAGTMPSIFDGSRGPEEGCYLYGRHFNPTVYVLGKQLAAIEGTEAGYCASSGMGAISAVIMQLCGHGDHVISSNTIYGGSFALLNGFLPAKLGIDVSFMNVTDYDAIEAAFTDRTRLLFIETMANPTLVVPDIPRLAEIAHRHGAKLVVDNTFCPMIVAPATHGADIVVHSLTKFISGASDIIAGAICGSEEFITSMMDLHMGSLMLLGPTMDPAVAFNISLRLPHLGVRMAEHSKRALAFAERLEQRGVKVIYPGLPTHPHHAMLKRLMNDGFGYGGMLGIDIGDADKANQFMEILQNRGRFGYLAVSLGYFDTLMSCSAISTSSELTDEAKESAGISPGLVRMSIGYTGSLEQRWEQLDDALRTLNIGN